MENMDTDVRGGRVMWNSVSHTPTVIVTLF